MPSRNQRIDSLYHSSRINKLKGMINAIKEEHENLIKETSGDFNS